jgi:hypothetical protein
VLIKAKHAKPSHIHNPSIARGSRLTWWGNLGKELSFVLKETSTYVKWTRCLDIELLVIQDFNYIVAAAAESIAAGTRNEKRAPNPKKKGGLRRG